MAFKMRTSKPAAGNKYYNNGNNGGESWCINGYPTDKDCNVLANCFAGETKYVTEEGLKDFKSTVGTTQMVLNENGEFVPAEIKDFGVQKLYKITFNNGYVVYATDNHRWVVDGDVREIKTTLELNESDLIPYNYHKDENKEQEYTNVKSIESTDREEVVYCAVEPITHTITLEKNILTGQCVGYACGRFNEIIGSFKYKTLCCNAENFIERAKEAGLKISDKPTLGGIMVWKKGSTLSGDDGAGHVAIVERIDSANQVYTSESGYGGSPFWNTIRTNNNGRWGMNSSYTYRGCIVNPSVEEEPTPTPTPMKFKVGDKVVVNGAVYTNANAAKSNGSITNKVTNITRVEKGAKHPYNTTGDLGWMNEADIKPYTEPTREPRIGDVVVISGPLFSNANAAQASGSISSKTTIVTRYVSGAAHPYNTTGDIGWMNKGDVKLYDGKKTYTVQPGDTLSSIASKYGMTWEQLYAKNKFVIGNDPNLIKPGQVLTI